MWDNIVGDKMREIRDKYTGLEFKSRQEYDQYRRTPEYHAIQREFVKKWANVYECYFCNAVFDSIDELRNHIQDEHLDKLSEITTEALGGI